MFADFENKMAAEAHLTPAETSRMLGLATIKKLKRGESWVKEGDICHYKGYIIKGLLKVGSTRENGLEYIMRFSRENDWIVDAMSFSKMIPTQYSISAIEPTTMLVWTRDDFASIHNAIPALKSYMSSLLMTTMYNGHERIRSNISDTSEEKYQSFINAFPDLVGRLPLHLIAAYIGLSRETLSRIRHAQTKTVNPTSKSIKT